MDSTAIKNMVVKSIFFILLIASFILIVYCLQYNVLLRHDILSGYGRTVYTPEHGRYAATYINSILTEHLPYFFNIHPNMFAKYVVYPLRAIITILFCLVFANSFSLFKKEETNILKFDFGSIAFLFTYIVTFSFIFNVQIEPGFLAYENVIFWEYPCSLFYIIIFFNILIYYLANPKSAQGNTFNKNYIIMLIFAFLTGISIEPINAPVLFVMSVLFILFLFNKKKFDEDIKKKVFLIFKVYLLAIFLYYIMPNDEQVNLGTFASYKDYLINAFPLFLKAYIHKFCLNYMIYYTIPILFFAILIYIKKNSNRNIVNFALLNLFAIFFFNFAIFVIGYCDDSFYFTCFKWCFLYTMFCLYLLVLLIGYYIDVCIKSNKDELIKSIFCIVVFLIFANDWIYQYQDNIAIHLLQKDIKMKAYVIEKLAINQLDGDTIYIPKTIILPNNEELKLEDSVPAYAHSTDELILLYRILHYPEMENKKQLVFDDDYKIDENMFTHEEIEKLDFQKLLTHRIHKNELRSEFAWKGIRRNALVMKMEIMGNICLMKIKENMPEKIKIFLIKMQKSFSPNSSQNPNR